MDGVASALTLIVLIAAASIIGFLVIVYSSTQPDTMLDIDFNMLNKLVEDNIPCNSTNNVFSPGPVGFAISAGYRAPGENIGVHLHVYKPHKYFFNGSYIVRIYGFDGNRLFPVLSRNISATSLPANIQWRIPIENYYHGYVIIVLAVEDNHVIDCVKGLVIVPEQRIEAKIVLDKNVYRVGETVEFKIVNLGDTPISFGRPYQVYYLSNGKWVPANELTPDTWTMELIILRKSQSFTQKISLENAVPGRYKIVKIVRGEGTSIAVKLEAEFTVVSSN